MKEEFKSLTDLYNKIKPALKTKENELRGHGIKYIKQEDIWNCLKEVKWKNSSNLSLSEMVNDVLEISIDNLDMYVKKQISELEKIANLQEGNNLF